MSGAALIFEAAASRWRRLNYSTMHLFRMTRQQRSRCVDVILAYYRLHVPDFPDMKTLEVLRQNND